jgi:hypothetical protein
MCIIEFQHQFNELRYTKVSKAIPVTDLGGLTDDGKVVSPTHPLHFTPQKHFYFNVSGTHSC